MARRTPAATTRPTRRTVRPTRTSDNTPAPAAADQPAPTIRPDVIVDFSVDRGLLVVSLQNIGGASAYRIVTHFDRAFHGLGGHKDLSTLALFRSLLFLPPGKRISQLVDHADAYFQREEPTRLTATITYTDRDGRRYSEVIPHDLDIYRDLAPAESR